MSRFTSQLIKNIKKHSSQERKLMCAVEFFNNCTRRNRIKRLSTLQIKQCMRGIEQIIPLLDGDERDNMIYLFEKLMVEKQERRTQQAKGIFSKLFKFVFRSKAY